MSGMEDRFTTKVRGSRNDWRSVVGLMGEVEGLGKRYPAVAAHQLLLMVSNRKAKARKELRSLLNSEPGELFRQGKYHLIKPPSLAKKFFTSFCELSFYHALYTRMTSAVDSDEPPRAVCEAFLDGTMNFWTAFWGILSSEADEELGEVGLTNLTGWVSSRISLSKNHRLNKALSCHSEVGSREQLLLDSPTATYIAWNDGGKLGGLSDLPTRVALILEKLGNEEATKNKVGSSFTPERELATAGADDIELLHFEAHEAALKENHRIEFLQLAEAAKLSKRERQLLEIELRLTVEHVDFHDSDIAREMGVKETTVRVWRHRYHRKIREAAA